MGDGREALRAAIARLSVRDRVVFVQSSWKALRKLVTSMPDAIELLSESVGENGTLLMPAFPMSGLSQTHLDEHPFFDCRHTPSRTGALTEAFRQTPGAHRSMHPTHSVAAWGRQAVALTNGHQNSPTPFDPNSPFHRMWEADAVCLNFGVHVSSFNHLADHMLQDELPHDVYADRVTRVRLVDCEGVESYMETRGHNPSIRSRANPTLNVMWRGARRRWLRPLRWVLLRGALLDLVEVGGLRIEYFTVRDYVRTQIRLYRRGVPMHFPRHPQALQASGSEPPDSGRS
jgi:aminoglycoside 3-N-acetyltransferase